MLGQCASMGFTEIIGEIMVAQRDTCHVNQSIVRNRFVREEKLVDLGVIHLRETGNCCGIDEGNLWSNQRGQKGQSFEGDWSQSYCLWWHQGVSLQQRAEHDTAQYPVNQWIEVGEPVMSHHCSTAWVQWSYVKHYGVLVPQRRTDWKVNSGVDNRIFSAIE